jgi:two-component system, chemotaxis family, protein-glutamate methylesterase/glutaminase
MNSSEFFIVGVGASAGGQDALKQFFSSIPSGVNAAFVVVTHLFRDHKSELASILSRFTRLNVIRIQKYTSIAPGNVYVMPEAVIVKIHSGLLTLEPRPSDNIVNKSIDIFFDSLATEAGSRAIGVVLSGMGSDGSNGAVKIFLNGGDVLVQDPESTRFNSMPIATILKDHPDFILPPKELGAKITDMIQSQQQQRKEIPMPKAGNIRMSG